MCSTKAYVIFIINTSSLPSLSTWFPQEVWQCDRYICVLSGHLHFITALCNVIQTPTAQTKPGLLETLIHYLRDLDIEIKSLNHLLESCPVTWLSKVFSKSTTEKNWNRYIFLVSIKLNEGENVSISSEMPGKQGNNIKKNTAICQSCWHTDKMPRPCTRESPTPTG